MYHTTEFRTQQQSDNINLTGSLPFRDPALKTKHVTPSILVTLNPNSHSLFPCLPSIISATRSSKGSGSLFRGVGRKGRRGRECATSLRGFPYLGGEGEAAEG